MNRVMRSVVIFFMLIAVSSTTSHAWYYYANAKETVWEEVSTESETLPAGTVISVLPDGARSVIIERTQYFISGGNWFLPIISNEGVKYQVVFAPV
jgi:hypothetical protein